MREEPLRWLWGRLREEWEPTEEEADRRLADAAIRMGWITPQQVEQAIGERDRLRQGGGVDRLEQVLVRRQWLTPDQVAELHREQGGTPGTQPSPPEYSVPLEPSKRIGRYEILEELGRGGTSRVYRARDSALKRDVAIKVLDHPQSAVRLQREAEIVARLRHPHIVEVHDIGTHEEMPYLAMELIEGRSLAKAWMEWPLQKKVTSLEEIARAVAYAHEAGVVHRDLKPTNVMVTAADEVKVMDFGLALLQDDRRLTVTGTVMGTPSYMSPEQVRGERAGPASDVYALGVMLYEAITGEVPFVGTQLHEVYQKVLTREPVRPRAIRPGIAADLETICLKALEKAPGHRYPSAASFAEDLRRWRKRESIDATPVPTAVRVWRKAARHPTVVLPAVLAAALTAAVAAWGIVGAQNRAKRVRVLTTEADALRSQGKIADARERYLLALQLDGGNERAREGAQVTESELNRLEQERERAELGRRKREEVQHGLDTADHILQAAARYFYDKDSPHADCIRQIEKARPLLDEAVTEAPDLARGHFLLGKAWELSGRDDRAEASWRQAIRLDPQYDLAHFYLGRLLLRWAILGGGAAAVDASARRRLKEGSQEIESATALEDPVMRLVAEALSAYVRRDLIEQRRLVREGMERFRGAPGIEDLHLLEALSLHGAEAQAAFDRALEVCPRYALVLFFRGAYRRVAGDFEGAVADLSRAVEIKPHFYEGWSNLGFARLVYGDKLLRDGRSEDAHSQWKTAVTDMDRAVELADWWTVPRLNRAETHRRLAEFDAAILDYTAVIKINEKHADAYFGRAMVSAQRGNREEAAADLRRALEVAPREWGNRAAAEQLLRGLEGAR